MYSLFLGRKNSSHITITILFHHCDSFIVVASLTISLYDLTVSENIFRQNRQHNNQPSFISRAHKFIRSQRKQKKMANNKTSGDEPKWVSDSADGRLLQNLVETGNIDGMTAAQIRTKYTTFAKYKNPLFTSNLRRFRERYRSSTPNRRDGNGGKLEC
jgi:hypothetical protein